MIDAEKPRNNEKLTFDLDGIFSAAWSPNGQQIAFVGNKANASDIYLYDLENKTLINLTNDIYSDSEPVWNPNGNSIAYVSSRNKSENDLTDPDLPVLKITHFQTDIFTLDISNNSFQRITDTDANENYPAWANTSNVLFYTSDESGISNLYKHDMDKDKIEPLTNILTGLFQISLSKDDEVLVFAGYSDNGWDIFRLSNPLQMKQINATPTQFSKNQLLDDDALVDFRQNKSRGIKKHKKYYG